jgi:hypothetical protein
MVRLDHPVEDLHLPGSPIINGPADTRDYCPDHRTSGWRQLLCAWFIVLTIAALLKVTNLISPNRTTPFAHVTDLAHIADVEQVGEIERWERGVPRQRTMAMPSQHKIVLVSRADQ